MKAFTYTARYLNEKNLWIYWSADKTSFWWIKRKQNLEVSQMWDLWGIKVKAVLLVIEGWEKNKTKQVLCSSSARLSGLFNFWSWHITHCWADVLNEHECRVETTNKPRALPSLMSHQQQQRNVDKLGRISKLVWMLWTCYEQCHVIWETWNNVILKQYDKTCDNADLYSYLDKVTS